MSTPTATLPPAITPVPDLPLSGDLPLAGTQTGSCPMMSGSTLAGCTGMSGMGMSGSMSGMQGMSGMNGTMPYYATPWYENPWLMLGWLLLVIVVTGILAGIVFGVRWIIRNSKSNRPADIS